MEIVLFKLSHKADQASDLFLTCLDTALTTCLFQSAPVVTSKPGALWIRQGVDLERVEPLEGVWPTKAKGLQHSKTNNNIVIKITKPELQFACRLDGTISLQPEIISKNPTNCIKTAVCCSLTHGVSTVPGALFLTGTQDCCYMGLPSSSSDVGHQW